MDLGTITYRLTNIPDDNDHVILFDSTRFGVGTMTTTTVETGDAVLAPGTDRGRFAGYMISGVIKNGDQAITVYEQILTGTAGVEADWETHTLGTLAIAASTTQPFEWKPVGRDFRIKVTAGANNPNSLTSDIVLTYSPNYAV